MPRTPCPACQSDVTYPTDADPGTTVTCPECDEAFTPPKLKKKVKRYDPATDEDTYTAERATSDLDEKEKSRKVAAAVYHAKRRAREDARPKYKPLIGGVEIVLLVFGAAATLAVAVGYTVAKRFPNTGEGALIVFAYCGVLSIYGFRIIRARWRAEG